MATSITTNLNDQDEAILVRLTDERNADPDNPTPLSPAQMFREIARGWIRSQAARFAEKDQLGLRAAYKRATPAEQATIDALLAPYR